MSHQKRDYDSTVARIAGNIFSGLATLAWEASTTTNEDQLAAWCVERARSIVAETKRTEPPKDHP